MSEKLGFRCKFFSGEDIKFCSAQGPYETGLEKPSLAKDLKDTKVKACIAVTSGLPPSNSDHMEENCDFFIKRRPDQTKKLGEPLSKTEEHIYRKILLSGIEPISKKRVFERIYNKTYDSIYDAELIWTNISRLRKKLGKESIITYPGGRYITRRALINHGVYDRLKYFEINGKMDLFDNLPELDSDGEKFYYRLVNHGSKLYRMGDFTTTLGELEVLMYADQGLTFREIGQRLNISYDTVHRRKRKLKRANLRSDDGSLPDLDSLIEKARGLSLLKTETINRLKRIETNK